MPPKRMRGNFKKEDETRSDGLRANRGGAEIKSSAHALTRNALIHERVKDGYS